MGNFTEQDVKQFMKFYISYYSYILAGNTTTRRLFVTGILNEVIQTFEKRITKSSSVSLYLYSDHDDSIVELAAAFQIDLQDYPPYASQIVFELWSVNENHEIRMRLNDIAVILKGPCENSTSCNIERFKGLAKNVSFYDDEEGYFSFCKGSITSFAP